MAKSQASWLADIDALIRPAREHAAESRPEIALNRLIVLALGLGATYGFFMGWYAVVLHWGSGRPDGYFQLLAGAIKLPALFLCTLVVTFPSLYVFSALAGVELDLVATLRLLVSGIVVNLAVAASLGTILAFFTLSTTSYPFMVVLNALLLGVAGVMGLGYLRRTLAQLAVTRPARESPVHSATENAATPEKAAASIGFAHGALPVFRVWMFIYALVGMQMGWLLRPFIGRPELAFTLFRARSGNFFLGILDNLGRMFSS
jgi:hypothetical protein